MLGLLRRRVAHECRNTYTVSDDVLLCAKPEDLAVAENQAGLKRELTGQEFGWWRDCRRGGGGMWRRGRNEWHVTCEWQDRQKPGHQHDDLISHSLTVSSHWATQTLPCPNNAVCLAKKRQGSVLKSLVWLDQDFNLWIPWSPKTGDGRSTHSTILTGRECPTIKGGYVGSILGKCFALENMMFLSDICCSFCQVTIVIVCLDLYTQIRLHSRLLCIKDRP